MSQINDLYKIADYLGLEQIVSELRVIENRSNQENANLILPLVGEFSSGKTTLINALTDSRKLETATKPTTATIYEVHFGCDKCHAQVLDKDGKLTEVADIADLKNDKLKDAQVVTVFDTSKKISSTTILVDTPGLSSPDPKHKQTLVNFMPKADGILLVIDINQQITRSLTNFIETMKLSKRPIFLVLTKSDTKSAEDIENAKTYISKNSQIPVKQIVAVSATTDKMDELYQLLSSIQQNKKEIISQVDQQREKQIVKTLLGHVEELMGASSSDQELTEAIRRCQYELDKINRNIDKLVDSMNDDIEECGRNISRQFEDTIYTRLSSLVSGKSNNYDQEAISIINTTAALLMNEYRNGIQQILRDKAMSQKGKEGEVPLASLEALDLSTVQMTGLNYNLELNGMGHEHDGMIKMGVIAAAAVTAVAATVATAGASAGAMAGIAVDSAIDVADTVTDVGSIISNQRTANRIENAVGFARSVSNEYTALAITDQQMGQQMGQNKGIIDSMVGFVTEKMMSKPQRSRAIRNYIDSTLMPEFKLGLNSISSQLTFSIRETLHHEAAQIIEQKTISLNQLKAELKEQKDLFNQRMEQLREFQTLLLTF